MMPGEAPLILLVDDQESNRYVLARTLGSGGFRVQEARTGAEALRQVAGGAVDAVVCDVRLPDISGYEILKRIKGTAATSHIPVLLISAYFSDAELEGMQLQGTAADGYLPSPVEAPVLLASVRSLLRAARAEQALRAATDQLRKVAAVPEENPDGVLRLSGGRHVDYANPPAREILRVLGSRDGLAPAVLSQPAVAALEDGQRREVEVACGERTFLVNFAPFSVEGYVNLYAREITDRKRAEEALRQSEERFAKAFRASPHALVISSLAEGTVREVNEEFVELFGLSRQEAIGRRSTELGLFADVSDRERAMDLLRREGRVRDLEMRIRARANEMRTVLLSVEPIRLGNEPCILTIIWDITEHRRAEEALRESDHRLRLAATAAHLFAFEWDPITDVVRREGDAAGVLGVPFHEETGASFFARIHPEDRARFSELMRSLRPEHDSYSTTYRVVRPGGGEAVLEESGRASFDKAGRFVRLIGMTADITERRRAEQAILRQRELLAAIIDNIPVVLCIWDPQLRSFQFNKHLRDVLGWSEAEAGDDFMAKVYPDPAYREEVIGYMTSLEGGWRDLRTTAKDGAVIDVSWANVALPDGRSIGIGVDIRQRKAAEESLRQSEERYRTLFNSIEAGFGVLQVLFDQRGRADNVRFLAVNPAFLRLTGMRDPVGRTVREVLTEVNESLLQLFGNVAITGQPGRCVDYAPEVGRWFDVYAYRIGDAQERKVAVLFSDITFRKQAEEALHRSRQRLSLALDAIGASQSYWDVRTGRLEWNARAYTLLGYEPGTFEPSYEKWRSRVHPEDLGWVEATVKECMEQRKDFFGEYRVVWPDGSCHWVRAARRFEYDEMGEPTTCTSILYDITDLKRIEEQLRRAKEAAEAANRAKDQFIAVLSHELRTPLTPAVAALSLLRRDVRLPSDAREDLEVVSSNIDLEVRLIADLLDVSRIISGKLHLERRPVDVADAIREAAKIVSGDLDAKGQILVIETPGAPYLALADGARLQQVFWNLLRNSAKFSPARSRIIVRARVEEVDRCPLASQPCPMGLGECEEEPPGDGQESAAGGNLVVEVIDEGSGIAPEMLPRLFNAFEQEQKARSFGGLGLGLSICRAVVEMHGGRISAQSEGAGRGSTFTVRLPVARCEASGRLEQQARGDSGRADEPARGGSRPLRVLLVEDHVDTARLMRRFLMADGHEVTTVGSVAEGLGAVRQERPDVLISDLGLPDGSGLELMSQLRAQGIQIPGIALSGYGTPGDIERSKEAGFAEHLVKPLSSPELLNEAIIRLWVGSQKRRA